MVFRDFGLRDFHLYMKACWSVLMIYMLSKGSTISSWLPTGRTMLISKNQWTTGQLHVWIYKLWTSQSILMHHCIVNDVLHLAQKGCSQDQLDHLLLSSHICRQVKSKYWLLSSAWLNYKKALDSAPHNWIVYCLQMFKFHCTITKCTEKLYLQ